MNVRIFSTSYSIMLLLILTYHVSFPGMNLRLAAFNNPQTFLRIMKEKLTGRVKIGTLVLPQVVVISCGCCLSHK